MYLFRYSLKLFLKYYFDFEKIFPVSCYPGNYLKIRDKYKVSHGTIASQLVILILKFDILVTK